MPFAGDTLRGPGFASAKVIDSLISLFEACIVAIAIVFIVIGGVYLFLTERNRE
jgi:hypothetical protein